MKTVETTPAETYAAARAAGCIVESQGDGSFMVSAPDGWGAARFLASLCISDEGRPNLLRTAEALQVPGMSAEDYARTVHEYVKETIRFAPEDGEIFQAAHVTAESGVGDCDCHARVVIGLLRARQVPARLAFLALKGGQPMHVTAQAFHDGAWHWVETTCDAAYGEEPFHAAKRLGIVRSDIPENREVITMGEMAEVRTIDGIFSASNVSGINDHAGARAVLRDAWVSVVGSAPSSHELDAIQTIASFETGYGRAGQFAVMAARGQYNWGALQKSPVNGECSAGTVPGMDSSNSRCFFVFSSDVEAAAHYIKTLVAAFPARSAAVRAALKNGTLEDLAAAMKTAPAYFEAPVSTYAAGLESRFRSIFGKGALPTRTAGGLGSVIVTALFLGGFYGIVESQAPGTFAPITRAVRRLI